MTLMNAVISNQKCGHLSHKYYKLLVFTLFTPFFLSCDGSSEDDISYQALIDIENENYNNKIIISEASSLNTMFHDSDGETPDWFEIYNNGDSSVNLNGWTATDDSLEITKWQFPNITIAPNEHLLIWASGKDRFMHSSFKLSNEGEIAYLFNQNGLLIDSLNVTGLATDTSVGRSVNDGRVVYYQTPTPGAVNNTDEFLGIVRSEVVFSDDGGEFSGDSVSLSGLSEGETIYYTVDSFIPTVNSSLYSMPIDIPSDMIVRAKIFKENFIPSRTFSRSFIKSQTHSLPIVSLITENKNLFDQDIGIYAVGPEENLNPDLPYSGANFGKDWERDVNFSFYDESGNMAFSVDAGIKIYGGFSRTFAQKSLSIFFRKRYGMNELNYSLFPSLEYQKFQSIILRNTGNDWMRAQMRDTVSAGVMNESGLELQAHRPVAVYLNGQYWGFYNIREKINEHFLNDKIDVQKSQINLLENDSKILFGTNEEYLELINFVEDNNLDNNENFEYVADKIDIDNFITYQVAQIYLNNRDWPANNIKFWNSPSTKWRWILYDTDFGWSLSHQSEYMRDSMSYAVGKNDGEPWIAPPWSTLLLRKLLDNPIFKEKFLTRFSDELNSRFKPSSIRQQVESISFKINEEMINHFDRWREDYNSNVHNIGQPNPWPNSVEIINTFAENRISFLRAHIENYFELPGSFEVQITLSDQTGGEVILNSLSISRTDWKGIYFDGIPISLTAIPDSGYRFSHWMGDINSEEPNIEFTSSDNISIEAVFHKI